MDEITIRAATAEDIPHLVRLRRLMFESMGYQDAAQLDAGDRAAQAYFEQALPGGTFWGWVACTPGGEVVGSGGAVIDQRPPGPWNLSGQTGYIMNVVTEPAYRRQGIARRIMQTILDWLAARGIKGVSLHASDMGRPLYQQLGFTDTNLMQRRL